MAVAESERTCPLPGPALGCEPAEVKFQPWERRERRGALKSVFNWKVKPQQHHTKPTPVNDNKDKKSDKSEVTKPEKVDKTRQESVDRTILKIMSRGRRSGLKTKPRVIREKDGWRGPREQPCEIPVQKQISKKKPQVPLKFIEI